MEQHGGNANCGLIKNISEVFVMHQPLFGGGGKHGTPKPGATIVVVEVDIWLYRLPRFE